MGNFQVEAGDTVIVSNGWRKTIAEVEKVTPTGLIKVLGTLYHPDGSERGGGWGRSRLCEATPEAIQLIQNQEVVYSALNKMHECKRLTLEQAKQILAVLDKS